MMDESLRQGWTRRSFLKSAAAMAVAQRAWGASANNSDLLAYVGTYTSAVDGPANGEGIYLFEMDADTGKLTRRGLVAKARNPSWIAIHPSGKYLYAVNEVSNLQGSSGAVSAFAIDEATSPLSLLNTVSSEGAAPAHLSIDVTGKFVFVANYGGGSIAVLPILADGKLGTAVDIHRDTGSLGGKHATNAPAGSFAVSGHDAPHAHMIAADAWNKFVVATDLGQDRVYVDRFDAATGKLTPSSFVALPSGDGPRHFAFHPNGHWLYTIQEEASTIGFFGYDGATGTLDARQTISSLPAGFAGTSFASEIVVSPDGRFLYAANRLHDTIAVVAIGSDGMLRYMGETPTLGDYPRHCRIDPTGNFLFVCNQHSDSITSFRIDRESGLLAFTGEYTAVGSPAILTFLPI